MKHTSFYHVFSSTYESIYLLYICICIYYKSLSACWEVCWMLTMFFMSQGEI